VFDLDGTPLPGPGPEGPAEDNHAPGPTFGPVTLQDVQAEARRRRSRKRAALRAAARPAAKLVAHRLKLMSRAARFGSPGFQNEGLRHASTGYIGFPDRGLDFNFLVGSPEARMQVLLGGGYRLIRGVSR
jgi:hypothetical protein